jgi:hypothetical protein
MDKQTGNPYNSVSFSDKKKWAVKPQKGMENLKCILASGKKAELKRLTIQCTIPTKWHSAKGNTMTTIKSAVFAGSLGGERDE